MIRKPPSDKFEYFLQLMINIKRSTPTVSREITPHFDRKEKYSQKRTRESNILKSKVHLATSGTVVFGLLPFIILPALINVTVTTAAAKVKTVSRMRMMQMIEVVSVWLCQQGLGEKECSPAK